MRGDPREACDREEEEIINDMKADAAMMKQKSHTIITAGHHQGDKMSRLMTLLQTSVLNILSL